MVRDWQRLFGWSRESVVAEIRRLHARGERVTTFELARRGHSRVVAAARQYIGSWRDALQLAGVRYEPKLRRWTNDSVLGEIRRLHREGKSLSSEQVEGALVSAATKRFGTWRKARAAAVPSYEKEGWSKPLVLRRIRERHIQGKSMSATGVEMDDLALHAAARRYLGSWKRARAAARVPYKDPRHRWTDRSVIAALRRLAVDGVRPTTTKAGPALYRAAVNRFGSFERACLAAGLRDRSGRRRGSRERDRQR